MGHKPSAEGDSLKAAASSWGRRGTQGLPPRDNSGGLYPVRGSDRIRLTPGWLGLCGDPGWGLLCWRAVPLRDTHLKNWNELFSWNFPIVLPFPCPHVKGKSPRNDTISTQAEDTYINKPESATSSACLPSSGRKAPPAGHSPCLAL